MEFEKLKKNDYPTDRPIPEKQGQVRGNKNIFKVGLMYIPNQKGPRAPTQNSKKKESLLQLLKAP